MRSKLCKITQLSHPDNPLDKVDIKERYRQQCRVHMGFLVGLAKDKCFDIHYLEVAIEDAKKKIKMIADIRAMGREMLGEEFPDELALRIVNYFIDHYANTRGSY